MNKKELIRALKLRWCRRFVLGINTRIHLN
jgi:hypothetical protein